MSQVLKGIGRLLRWTVMAGSVVIVVGGLGITFLQEVVLIDRLTLHNATSSPVVFSGARGPVGSRTETDIYVEACESREFEWATVGWTTEDMDAFEPVESAIRVEVLIRPPMDGIAGAHYIGVVTEDGVHEVEEGDPIRPCDAAGTRPDRGIPDA